NLIQHFVPVHQCEGPLVDKLERNIMCISNFGYFFFQMSDLWLQQSYIILIGFFFKLPSPTCMSLKINTAVFCRLLYFFGQLARCRSPTAKNNEFDRLLCHMDHSCCFCLRISFAIASIFL